MVFFRKQQRSGGLSLLNGMDPSSGSGSERDLQPEKPSLELIPSRSKVSWKSDFFSQQNLRIKGQGRVYPPNSVGPMVFIVFNLGILGDYTP